MIGQISDTDTEVRLAGGVHGRCLTLGRRFLHAQHPVQGLCHTCGRAQLPGAIRRCRIRIDRRQGTRCAARRGTDPIPQLRFTVPDSGHAEDDHRNITIAPVLRPSCPTTGTGPNSVIPPR